MSELTRIVLKSWWIPSQNTTNQRRPESPPPGKWETEGGEDRAELTVKFSLTLRLVPLWQGVARKISTFLSLYLELLRRKLLFRKSSSNRTLLLLLNFNFKLIFFFSQLIDLPISELKITFYFCLSYFLLGKPSSKKSTKNTGVFPEKKIPSFLYFS